MQRHYPEEQMHRIQYTKLTETQISDKLMSAVSGPKAVSDKSEVLAGLSIKIVTDTGPVLEYSFKNASSLTLSEGGGRGVDSAYGALTLKNLVLVSHMIPGTQKGYNLVIDLDTNLATVFEVWFSGYEDKREVQREVYFGYVEERGQNVPKARHGITNRIEGKGLHWTQDNGIETLEYFPSVLYSTFVELTRFGGELMFCGPSDYIKINDELYIYSRVECEFSGVMTLYAIDLATVTQAGVRLGFDENDDLEYYLFNGTGEIVGQIAQFEPFGDLGEKFVLGNRAAPTQKGERMVYRPIKLNPPMTEQEVHEAVQANISLFKEDNDMAGNKGPISHHLIGKELTVRYDSNGPVYEYRFDELRKLRWRKEGERRWNEEVYEAYEPAEEMIFFSHLHSGTRPQQAVKVVLDLSNGLSTCVHGTLGTPYKGNEVTPAFYFGVIEMEGITAPRYFRHGFTEELVGQAVTWNYKSGLTSMHLYATPHSYSWIIFLENGAGGLEWSSPAWYVKLRDDTYLFSWVEEACNGSLGTIVYNTRTMHDAGFGYHVGHDGLSLDVIGAYARNAGKFDVAKYYGPKA